MAGCSKDPNILDQAKAIKGQPAPTAEQMKKGFEQVAANHQKATNASADWAKTHTPEEVAKVNAQRAAAGMPPLGK